MDAITHVLNGLQQGDCRGQEEMVLVLYEELRALARQKMSNESTGHTLQPTALVHEVWLRLVVPNRSTWQNRAHFFAAASEAMRRILLDHARRKHRLKRGGGVEHEDVVESAIVLAAPTEEIIAVDEAVDELAKQDPQVAELVKLRYFVGMTMAEAASALGLAPRSAERLWTFGRTWLRNHIRQSLALSEMGEKPNSSQINGSTEGS
jgi:RNA polymerase sigma factor (TIGR02999 family)